jgi:VIT1/CCC1 family predicted Fe2+/Mn2+ transporter
MSSKLEQEIEEILARTGGPPPPARFRPRGSSLRQAIGGVASSVASLLARINAGQLMLASILLIIGSWFVLRQWETAMTVVALAGLALFVLAFVLAIARRRTRGSGPPEPRYWRGQPIDYDQQSQGTFRNPFRNLFRRR